VILRVEHARHPTIRIEQPDAADRPVSTNLREFVRVQRHVGAVEAADPEMQDARHERSAVVVRHGNAEAFDLRKVGRREAQRHAVERTSCVLMKSSGFS
jgi:hypothetical protein